MENRKGGALQLLLKSIANLPATNDGYTIL